MQCSVDTVIAAEFHPLDRNQIVTCGKGHIAFWTLDASNVLYKRMGVFDTRDKPKYVTCLGFNHNGRLRRVYALLCGTTSETELLYLQCQNM